MTEQTPATCDKCQYWPVQTDDKRGWTILLCPLHAAAEELVRALEAACKWTETFDATESYIVDPKQTPWLQPARQALRAAGVTHE